MTCTCPKCKEEQSEECLAPENNPNLVTCRNPDCTHNYFVEIILKYKKAFQKKDKTYALKEELN